MSQYLIPLILALAFFSVSYAEGYVSFNQVPTGPVVGFDFNANTYAQIQSDYCFSLKAFDDRGYYHKNYNPSIGPLQYANVTVNIFSADGQNDVETIEGKTSIGGYFAACDFVTSHQYDSHGLYNMTMSVTYGNSTLTQEIQFWTLTV